MYLIDRKSRGILISFQMCFLNVHSFQSHDIVVRSNFDFVFGPSSSPADLEITVGPEDANFTNGTSGRLECSAKGFPQPIISWTKEVEGQTVSLELSGRVQILANGSLFFSEVIMEDLGIYKCTATNSLGNSQESDTAMVMVFGEYLSSTAVY